MVEAPELEKGVENLGGSEGESVKHTRTKATAKEERSPRKKAS
jgi:hypothetical protein